MFAVMGRTAPASAMSAGRVAVGASPDGREGATRGGGRPRRGRWATRRLFGDDDRARSCREGREDDPRRRLRPPPVSPSCVRAQSESKRPRAVPDDARRSRWRAWPSKPPRAPPVTIRSASGDVHPLPPASAPSSSSRVWCWPSPRSASSRERGRLGPRYALPACSPIVVGFSSPPCTASSRPGAQTRRPAGDGEARIVKERDD